MARATSGRAACGYDIGQLGRIVEVVIAPPSRHFAASVNQAIGFTVVGNVRKIFWSFYPKGLKKFSSVSSSVHGCSTNVRKSVDGLLEVTGILLKQEGYKMCPE